jgi:hypothetical protein
MSLLSSVVSHPRGISSIIVCTSVSGGSPEFLRRPNRSTATGLRLCIHTWTYMQCWLVPRQKMGSTRSSPHARPSLAGPSLPKRYSTTLLLGKYSATLSPEAYDKRASAHIPPLVETVARCLDTPPPPYRSAPPDRPRLLRGTTERCGKRAKGKTFGQGSMYTPGTLSCCHKECHLLV